MINFEKIEVVNRLEARLLLLQPSLLLVLWLLHIMPRLILQ